MIDWFVAALINIVFGAVVWLALKRARINGLSNEKSLLLYFVILSAVTLVWEIVAGTFMLLYGTTLLLLVSAGILAAVSNLCTMYSFDTSPNQGLTLAITASQSILVLLAGKLLFGSSLSIVGTGGVLLVLSGIFVLQRTTKTSRWSSLAVLSAVLSAGYWVLVKFADSSNLLSAGTILVYVAIPQLPVLFFAKLFSFSSVEKRAKKNERTMYFFWMILLSALAGVITNISSIFATTRAPNPGYATAVGSAGILLTIFASVVINKEKVTWKQVLAAIIIVLGVVAVRLGS